MSYNTRENLYEIVQMNISQKRKDIIKIDSIKSFRVVTEKYFWLTLLYCWHSRIIWSNVNAQLQEGHCGGSSRQRRYWCVRRVWPMRWQLCHASKVQKWVMWFGKLFHSRAAATRRLGSWWQSQVWPTISSTKVPLLLIASHNWGLIHITAAYTAFGSVFWS